MEDNDEMSTRRRCAKGGAEPVEKLEGLARRRKASQFSCDHNNGKERLHLRGFKRRVVVV